MSSGPPALGNYHSPAQANGYEGCVHHPSHDCAGLFSPAAINVAYTIGDELPTPDHRAVTRWAQRIWAILRLTTLNVIWTLRNQARLDPQGYTPQHRVQVQLKFWGQLRLLAVAHRYPPRELAVPGAQQHAFSVHCWDAIIPVILERLRIQHLLG